MALVVLIAVATCRISGNSLIIQLAFSSARDSDSEASSRMQQKRLIASTEPQEME